jgi:hypothetical protein
VGSALIAQDGPDRVLAPARLPLILLSGILGLLLFLWGRQIVGEIAALAAVFLYALDPTLLAHSFLATMDVGLAVFTLLFFFALWDYLSRPSNWRLVWCGLALGAVLAVKFSAVFLLPVAAALLWIAVKRPPASAAETPAGFLALYGNGKSESGAQPVAERYGAAACALVIMCLLAMLVVQMLYFSPDGLYLYSAGMERVNAAHDPNHMAYLAGRLEHHFTSYFVLAYLLKEPIPNLLLAGIGLVILLRSKAVGLMAKVFLLAPPIVLLVAHSRRSRCGPRARRCLLKGCTRHFRPEHAQQRYCSPTMPAGGAGVVGVEIPTDLPGHAGGQAKAERAKPALPEACQGAENTKENGHSGGCEGHR